MHSLYQYAGHSIRVYHLLTHSSHIGWKSSCRAVWRCNNDVTWHSGQVWRSFHHHPRPYSWRCIYGDVWHDHCCWYFQSTVCGPEFFKKSLYPWFLTGVWNGTPPLAVSRTEQERHTNRFTSEIIIVCYDINLTCRHFMTGLVLMRSLYCYLQDNGKSGCSHWQSCAVSQEAKH